MTRNHKCLIGLSPGIHRDFAPGPGFYGKTQQYLEQSVAHLVKSLGHLVVMVPTIEHEGLIHRSNVKVGDYVAALDGLILQGGADIHPSAYGEVPRYAQGTIDPIRDRFELDLLRGFANARKPVLGICRGMQLINVAFGGTLYQDLIADGATTLPHGTDKYDGYGHVVIMNRESWLSNVYPGTAHSAPMVNSIHHQGVKTLGQGLVADAWTEDGEIEAIRYRDDGFVMGVQWHPEFHSTQNRFLPPEPLFLDFLKVAAARRIDG